MLREKVPRLESLRRHQRSRSVPASPTQSTRTAVRPRDVDGVQERQALVFNSRLPWADNKLTYRRCRAAGTCNSPRIDKEHGTTTLPLELAIRKPADRFTLAMDVIDRCRG